MRSVDSAQATGLVGIYLLYQLNSAMPEIEGGLYRDDLIRKPIVGQLDNCKKKFHSFFNSYVLKITIAKEHACVNYLDATLDLSNGSFKPYHKNNESLKYVSAFSNHLFSTENALVYIISKRISNIFSNIDIFDDNAGYYNIALA